MGAVTLPADRLALPAASTRSTSDVRIRQSDLKTFARCPLQFRFEHIDGLPREQGGASVFGTVMHEAVLLLEETRDLAAAQAWFKQAWANPADPVTGVGPDRGRIDYWERGQSHAKGFDNAERILRDWWSIIQWETDHVLAREHNFEVDIGDGHRLHGTADKVAVRYNARLDTQVLLISDYKDLDRDTPLPTPTGWTTMGEVQVGEELIGGDGRPCRVTGKSQVFTSNDCYRVTFDDSTSVVAGGEHLWVIDTDGGRKILTTVQMQENLVNPVTGQRHLRIGNAALDLPEADLPIDPYVLGAWLGDGAASQARISKPLPQLFREIEACGYRVGADTSSPDRCETRTIHGLSAQLRTAGLLDNKHVPLAYSRASRAQRLALLQGIMDTDGHYNPRRQRCVVNTTDERFAGEIAELVCSLGWKATTFATTARGFGLVRPAWQVWFTPSEQVFRARPPVDWTPGTNAKSSRRIVRSIEPVPTRPTQCLTVDSSDSTFLCGEQMVRTHNTAAKRPTYDYLEDDLQFTAYAFASLQEEFWTGIPSGPELWRKYQDYPRWGEWVHLKGPMRLDAGERRPVHFNRLVMACNAFALSVDMRIFVPTISGETCKYCSHRKQCGLPPVENL